MPMARCCLGQAEENSVKIMHMSNELATLTRQLLIGSIRGLFREVPLCTMQLRLVPGGRMNILHPSEGELAEVRL